MLTWVLAQEADKNFNTCTLAEIASVDDGRETGVLLSSLKGIAQFVNVNSLATS